MNILAGYMVPHPSVAAAEIGRGEGKKIQKTLDAYDAAAGILRGCIGTTGPTCDNVAEEIIQNAISASARDPRFPAIKPEETPFLEISADVLLEPEDIDSPAMLDVHRYGVIISSGHRRGLLFPDFDGTDTVDEQIAAAAQKDRISSDEPYHMQSFEVIRHEDLQGMFPQMSSDGRVNRILSCERHEERKDNKPELRTDDSCRPLSCRKEAVVSFLPGFNDPLAGSFGCNIRCPFCQNYKISQTGKDSSPETRYLAPEELRNISAGLSETDGNIGVAFTSNLGRESPRF